MFRPRIIPVLLLQGNALVKSKGFKDFRYIGDPLNAVKLFNDLKADELVFLDIEATKEKRTISTELVSQVGEEANMPFAVGGGIKNLDEIQNIIAKGAEKVIINTCAVENPKFIREASDNFGSSTIVVCIDVKKKFFSGEVVWRNSGSKSSKYSPKDFAKIIEENGAGEIIIQSINKDGTMSGYDLDLVKEISTAVAIPVVALGGAGNLEHMIEAYKKGFASALAAGSLFVFQGPNKGVLINYVEKSDLSFFR
jgi:cyclase